MTENAPVASERVRRFPCASCGADVEYVPSVGLQCPFCGHKAGVPQNEDQIIQESSFEDYLHKPQGAQGYGAQDGRDVTCRGCGAITRMSGEAHSGRCAYCGANVVVEDKPDDGVVRPEAVLPFHITRQQAIERFHTWVAGLWFAPNELKRLKEMDQIFGVYRPFWTFDAATDSFYQGERGEHYYETETYRVGGETRRRQVRKTRWYPASGRVAHFWDDLLVPGGRPLGWETRYNLAQLKPYDAGYLAGWQAERYSVPPDRAWPMAKSEIDTGIHHLVERDIGGDEQRVHSIRTSYNAIKFKHLLLPLYIASYFYTGKTYRFQVNGATGEVSGERPYSAWKIALFVLAIVASIALILLLSSAFSK